MVGSIEPPLERRIVGGTLVGEHALEQIDLGIAQGRVVGLYPPGAAPRARQTTDATGLLVFPGFVDAHFHCRAPGHPEREDFTSGTAAAAAGGVTTVMEMPIAAEGVRNAAIFRQRQELAEAHAHVDVALWGGGGAAENDIAEMADAGAVGFKVFLHSAPAGREREFAGLCVGDSAALLRSFRAVVRTGLPCAVHCEDGTLVDDGIAALRARQECRPIAHAWSRPAVVEAVAVAQVLALGEWTGVSLHLPHISTAWALRLAREAKARGQSVTLETCPHYLFSDESALEVCGPYAKINPPLRPISDTVALREGLSDGSVDLVASDHAPYTREEKELGWRDIFVAPSGSPGVELLGPLLIDHAVRGGMPLTAVARLLSAAPARRFGLERKGRLTPEADADVVLVDPRREVRVVPAAMHTRSRDSAQLFAGRTLTGAIVETVVRGLTVFREGEVVGPAGHGRFVRPARSSVR